MQLTVRENIAEPGAAVVIDSTGGIARERACDCAVIGRTAARIGVGEVLVFREWPRRGWYHQYSGALKVLAR